jgi:hypothetical protein
MQLHTVTITGADNTTDINELVALSAEFPFVEWGILVSGSRDAGVRFPSRGWIDRFSTAARQHDLKVAMHVCGSWVSDLLKWELHSAELPSVVECAQRIQINSWGRPLRSSSEFHWSAGSACPRSFIFQWSPVGEWFAKSARKKDFAVAGLFDRLGGQGKSPDSWPSPHTTGFPMGFAGGLGPDNVHGELQKIRAASGAIETATWIDMVGQVRTEDGGELDMSRVRAFLEQVALSDFIEQQKCAM